jgi:hypothetical protein
LEKEAEDERLARVHLQTAIDPRSLSKKAQKEITETSRLFVWPEAKIIVKSTSGDQAPLAIQVAGALRGARFDVNREISGQVFNEPGHICSRDHLDIAQELDRHHWRESENAYYGILI